MAGILSRPLITMLALAGVLVVAAVAIWDNARYQSLIDKGRKSLAAHPERQAYVDRLESKQSWHRYVFIGVGVPVLLLGAGSIAARRSGARGALAHGTADGTQTQGG